MHYQIGRALTELGKLNRAQHHFEQAISLQPDHADALNDLGIVYAKSGETGGMSRAESCFRRAIEIDSSFADAHYNLALSHLARGDVGQAQNLMKTALRLDPEHPLAGEMLNRIQSALGEANTETVKGATGQ
jgi:Flp pilus assembly protein TadD